MLENQSSKRIGGLYGWKTDYEQLGNILTLPTWSSVRSSLTSSPEFTTDGMLQKCWRRISRKIHLYKAGTEGASNAGFEPYSEFYAAQVAQAMGINAIPYGLSKWKGTLCSTCELFTSKDYAFLPVGRLVSHGGFRAVTAYYQPPGFAYLNALVDMLIFDALSAMLIGIGETSAS